jgi:hypothetical protein
MALGHFVLVLTGNPQQVLTMTGRHRTVLAVNILSALALVIVGIVGGYLFGAPGLAAGSALSLALQNGLLWWLARRELGIWTHVRLLNRKSQRSAMPTEPLKFPPRDAVAPKREPLPESLSSSGVCP